MIDNYPLTSDYIEKLLNGDIYVDVHIKNLQLSELKCLKFKRV